MDDKERLIEDIVAAMKTGDTAAMIGNAPDWIPFLYNQWFESIAWLALANTALQTLSAANELLSKRKDG